MPTPFKDGRPAHHSKREAHSPDRSGDSVTPAHTYKTQSKEAPKVSATQVKYIVNGTVSNVWSRILKSKTTYVIAAFVLSKAEPIFTDTSWQTLAAWQAFGSYALGGAALIMIRSAIKSAELASNASNDTVGAIKAVEATKSPVKAYTGTAGLFAFVALMLLPLAGCEYGKGLANAITDADGKPIVADTICVNTQFGRICTPVTKPVKVEPPSAPEPLPPPVIIEQPVQPLTVATPVRPTIEK